jgi:Tol biopolymer transport system component
VYVAGACVAGQNGRRYFVVLDGVEQKHAYSGGANLTFSPDSRRFAYTAGNPNTKKAAVFLDGEKGKGYDGIEGLHFSPNGQRLAYVASRGGRRLVVVDGLEGREYDSIGAGPVFSPDSNHVTYTDWRDGKGFVVRDGVESTEFESFLYSVLSPDGKRMACFISENRGKECVVLDGKRDKEYEKVAGLRFSPNGRRFAYVAWIDDGMYVVLDGQEQQFYKAVEDVVFSPDSKRVAYKALSIGEKGEYFEHFVVVDGIEGKRYRTQDLAELINISPPIFSADSKHIAYVVGMENKCWMVVDEVEGKRYDEIRKEGIGLLWHNWDKCLGLSPDGKIAYWAKQDRRWRVVVDGVESKEYWGYLQKSRLVFETPNLLTGVAWRPWEICRVEIEINEN